MQSSLFQDGSNWRPDSHLDCYWHCIDCTVTIQVTTKTQGSKDSSRGSHFPLWRPGDHLKPLLADDGDEKDYHFLQTNVSKRMHISVGGLTPHVLFLLPQRALHKWTCTNVTKLVPPLLWRTQRVQPHLPPLALYCVCKVNVLTLQL